MENRERGEVENRAPVKPEKKVTSPVYLKKILHERGLRPRRAQGQHFLVDDNIQAEILRAASLDDSDYILDIGAGPGALSLDMAEIAAGVIAIEQDVGLADLLRDQAVRRGLERLQVVTGDVRRLDLHEIAREHWGGAFLGSSATPSIKVVANLPYYLTTPLLFQLLQSSLPLKTLVIMVQMEAARRIIAGPGGKDYGLLTILCKYYTAPRLLFKVPPKVFYPPPAVDSAVVQLDILPLPAACVTNEDIFWRLVKAAFQKRRKTLLNALEGVGNLGKDAWSALLQKAEIIPLRRGETLSLDEFARLANDYYTHSDK